MRSNATTIQRLTALWALCESGLGGWMHALKIPLTGFFVGGFAVVIIGLLAHYTRCNIRQMLQATLLVILVKAAVSPQSGIPAYVAVGFQGVAGALLYRAIPNYTIASVLFAIIAMLESAFQMLLMMTIYFGNSLWQALDKFFQNLLSSFHLPSDTSYSFWIIAIYGGIYTLWGLAIGIWIARLPKRIEAVGKIQLAVDSSQLAVATGKKSIAGKIVFLLSTLLFIATVFAFSGSMGKALYAILRTIAVLLLIFGIVAPLMKWAMQRFVNSNRSKHSQQLQPILDMMPTLRSYIRPAYKLATERYTGIRRYTGFLFILIAATLQPDGE
ncbi:hypothetical protein CAP35_11470 [Chitinophagaceae bacterium IBVUCB1]|nr:hypothetical protein CAP35_11470 [Chitinophagaceae bacterium IBVUCB1]